jgi:hypothetical protein
MKKIKKTLISLLLLSSLCAHIMLPALAFADDASSAPVTSTVADATGNATDTTTSDASQSTTSELDASTTQASTQEQHDDLSIHATSTIPTSQTTVTDGVTDVASTSQSGFLPSTDSGQVGDLNFASTTSTTTSDASTTPDVSITDPRDQGGNDATTTCAAITSTEDTSTTIATGTGSPTIRSGSATVLANILNLLNTNFINSPGGILFSNFTQTAPTIDLRDVSLLTNCKDSTCSGQDGLEVNVVDDASIKNQLLFEANSGQNAVAHSESQGIGTSTIETGDALAGLNLVNIANTTFLNSQYLIVTLNAFHGVNGDIVFPNLLDFFSSGGTSTALQDGSSIMNTANVANDVTAAADSGSNTTIGSDTSTISTGNADAHSNVFNQINSLLPNNQVSILFRISGTWNGQVLNAPSGVSEIRGPDGSVYIFGSPPSSGNETAIDTTLNSTSTADISNHVELGALSGQNAIDNASSSVIQTGDALAAANIVNIADQNVIGKNWILAIINIFGNFTGDIAFGRPDLWIADQVEAPGIVQNGSTLTYKITVINNGDAPAHNVVVTEQPDHAHIDVLGTSIPADPCVTDKLSWNVGTLDRGEAVEITYSAQLKNTSPGESVTDKVQTSEAETDNDPSDNTDSTTVVATVFGGGGGGSGGCFCAVPGSSSDGSRAIATSTLIVTRQTADAILDGTTTVPESIIVRNTSDSPVNDVAFHDYLRDPTTHLVHEERWNLDTVAPHEEITIQYSIVFDRSAVGGTYHLSTLLDGKNYPSTLAGNGTILIKATPQLLSVSSPIVPKVHIINRDAVQDGPILTLATSSYPGIPQTAAVAVVDSSVGDRFSYLVLFLLLFAASYGALRIFRAGSNNLPVRADW